MDTPAPDHHHDHRLDHRFGDLVLVPGCGCDERLFAPQIAALQHDARLHVVDNTGHSRIDSLAADALANLPKRFALAGLSQGGLIALEIIRQAPERVTRLALLDTLPGPGRRSDAVMHRIAIAMIGLRMFGPIEALMWPRYVHPDRRGDPALRRTVADMMRATGARGLANQQRIFISRPDYRPLLPRIAVPTLIVVGADDTLSPVTNAQQAAAAIPGAELAVIPHAAHLTTLEAPSPVTEVLQAWLERPPSLPEDQPASA